MTWQDVTRRDLTSVYRSRTGTAVAALVGLSTAVPIGLLTLANNFVLVAAVGAFLAVSATIALVFVGSPRAIGALVLTFTAAAIGMTVTLAPTTASARPDVGVAILILGTGLSFIIPLVALLGSYAALVGERETGSVRFLLGLPNSRDDAYFGKFVSRASILVGPLVVGIALAGAIVVLTFARGSPLPVLAVAAVSVPYALFFVGIGLTASAYAESSNRAVAVVIAVFVLFRAGWSALEWLLLQWAGEPHPLPTWYYWVNRLNPINAYLELTERALPGRGHPLVPEPSPVNAPIAPIATSDAFALVVLLVWTMLAPIAGLLYFRRRDLL